MGGGKKTSRVTRPSQTSVSSIGMGQGAFVPSPSVPVVFNETGSNLLAEGRSSFNRSLYNIVQYVFCCSKHSKVAITPTANTGGIIWLPFAVLPPDQTWEEGGEHGLRYFCGKHTDVDTVEGHRVEGSGVMSKYEMNIIELLRIQLPSERVEIRITVFVKLLPTEGFKCCQNTSNLQWEDCAAIFESASSSSSSSALGKFWSYEHKNYWRQLKLGETRYIYEFSIADAMSYFNRPDRKNSIYGNLLKATGISQEKVLALYESFLAHCSPAFSMSAESFGRYLAKFGVDCHSAPFRNLFHAACFNNNKDEIMKWFEFLFAIICIDPKTKSHEARHRLIFRMAADRSSSDTLTRAAFLKMASEVGITKNRLTELHAFDRFTQGDALTQDNFCRWMREADPPELDSFCRAPKSILASVVLLSRDNANATTKGRANKAASRVGRGTCERCRPQDFKYCLHCVEVEEEGLYCSKHSLAPNKMFVEIKTDEVDSERYSAEIRFADDSAVVYFFKLITNCQGFPAESLETLFENMTSLLQLCKAVFAAESRLLKINSPAVVVGDLLGSIDTALTIRQSLAPLAPVITANLIFLGNYTEKGAKANIAVLCLLFALKLQDPNKVLLLRGFNENGPTATTILQPQCEELFGRERGLKVMELLLQTFERMPLAVVIEEMLFAAHSGIPVSNPMLRMLLDIPATLRRIEDNPTAFELVSKVPVSKKTPAQPAPLATGQFTSENLATFLQVNSLTHHIRSAGGGVCRQPQSESVLFEGTCLSIGCNSTVPTVCYLDPGKKLECPELEHVSPSIQFVRLSHSSH